jgi:AcrR family transcriptional regulator
MTESDDGVPLRNLDQLWGTGRRPRRGRKPDLSLDRIAQAAIKIADADGLEALSMRRVAEGLGFTTMSLYRYVSGKSQLLAVMLDTAVGEPPRANGAGDSWRTKLALWARGNVAFFDQHPWALQLVTSRRPMGPNEIAWFEAALHAIVGTGLTEQEMVDVVLLVNSYVRGMAQISLDLAFAERQTGVTDEQWRSNYAPLLEKLAESNRYPTVASVLAAGARGGPGYNESERSFEFGLQRVLDGIEAFIQTRSVQQSRR